MVFPETWNLESETEMNSPRTDTDKHGRTRTVGERSSGVREGTEGVATEWGLGEVVAEGGGEVAFAGVGEDGDDGFIGKFG